MYRTPNAKVAGWTPARATNKLSIARSPPCSLQPIQPSAALTENAGVEPGPGRRPHLFSGIPLPASPLTPDAVRCTEPGPTAIHRYGSISLILRFFKDIPSHTVWPTFRMDADRCRGAHEHLPRKGVPGKLAGWGDMNAPQLAGSGDPIHTGCVIAVRPLAQDEDHGGIYPPFGHSRHNPKGRLPPPASPGKPHTKE